MPCSGTVCNGACLDAKVDPANCGACGNACAAGQVCSNGLCGATCSGGTTLCSGLCVNSANDTANCGACGNSCGAGQVCSQGACGTVCSGGTIACGSGCVDTKVDPTSCGACGNACGAGPVCTSGVCALACGGGSTKCGNACVATSVDPANCGACGNACPQGQYCSSGSCQTACSGTVCGNTCVDTANNAANCGACGNACGASQVCGGGACKCPAGQTACGNQCVNLSDNSLACGACGVVCGASQVCSAGVCTGITTGNGAAGGTLTGSYPPKVATAGAISSTDLQTKLTATGAFSSVGFINANTGTPTLAQLKAYDAVAVYTYLSVTVGFGDNLADYLEAGGGVVLFDYEAQETGSFALKGRYQTQYTLSTPVASSSFLGTVVTLGTLLEPASPLLTGVVTFGYKGTFPYHLPTSAFNKNSPIVVAQYSDGTPAVIRGVVNGGRNLVEINGFGLSATGNSSYGWDIASDGAKLIRNALLYVIPPLALTSAKQVDFGSQTLFVQSAPQAVTYTNASASPQTITALTRSGTHIGEFAASPSSALPATIPPGGTFIVNVSFLPAGIGLRAATLAATVQGVPGPATTLLTGNGI